MVSGAPNRLDDIGRAQRDRLRFIESSLQWEGSIRRQRVSHVFDVTVNHVTKDLRRYEAAFPNNILFDHRRQLYVPGPRFKPQLASKDPREYLALQLAHAQSGSSVVAPLLAGWDTVPNSTVPAPPHGITEGVLRHIVRAISQRTGVNVMYHSTRSVSGPDRRSLWPHALVHTGVRWHVRAYDDASQSFRNFALQRMDEPRAIDSPTPIGAGDDVEWMESTLVRVVPNPKLNAHQQQLVARDFGMEQSKAGPSWTLELRHCLIGYFAAKYGLDREEGPPRQRIVLENRAQVSKWFLPATSV